MTTLAKFHFTIPGEPCGKGRARATIRAGRATMYTPAKTVSYEAQIKFFAQQAYKAQLIEGPVAMHIQALFGIPKSWSKKKLAQLNNGEIKGFATKKPDNDNIQKIVADALNGVVYKDDSQIVSSFCTKYYGQTPGVTVWIEELADDGSMA